MKKKLEADLRSIALKIINITTSGRDNIDELHSEVAQLYEKLTVLKYAKASFDEEKNNIGNNSSFFEMLDAAFNNKISDTVEIENKTYVNLDERENDSIVQPVMDKIKDMVAHMPSDSEEIDAIKNTTEPSSYSTTTFEDIPTNYGNIPEFEPVTHPTSRSEITPKTNKPKSLNDKLKSNGLQIGLNDKLAFINHLFNGQSEDFHRVISQINTINNLQEAQDFINNLVKPDYNNWEGKEEYETRLYNLIEAKFD